MSRIGCETESRKVRPPGAEPKEEAPNKIQEDDSSVNESQWDDDHVTEIFKDYDLYLAAKNGNLGDFERVLERISATDGASIDEILCRLSPAGNTFLHVAAKHGHEDMVNFIAEKKPPLVLSKNFNGETALHLAAKAGDEPMVRALVKIQQEPRPRNERDENNLLRAKNERGNTALHEALFIRRDSIAEYLIQEDPELSYYLNKDGESALYLAAKAGFVNCVSLILRLTTDQERVNELFKKKSPIEAAIQGKHRDVLEAMFDMNPSFIQLRDDEGRNPLHHAASLGCLEEVRYLLKKHADSATQGDKSGSMPIHLASFKGNVKVVTLLLQDFPDPGELLDRHGRNILHLAAKHGRSDIVNFVLKNPDLKDLINMKDKHGNTPLHLASRHFWPRVVHALTWDKRVDITVVNDKGMTALGVALYYYNLDDPHRFPQVCTTSTSIAMQEKSQCQAAGTPHSPSATTVYRKNYNKAKTRLMATLIESANFRLLVSTLVAAVTFAAAFTVPGGHNSSDSGSDQGMATMLRQKAFHLFVFSDILAMYSSIAVTAVISWDQSHDYSLTMGALSFTTPLFWVSLTMMSIAFTSGLFLVVSKLRWLSTAVLVIGITFHFILLHYFLPLFIPLFRVIGYCGTYPTIPSICWH